MVIIALLDALRFNKVKLDINFIIQNTRKDAFIQYFLLNLLISTKCFSNESLMVLKN